MKYMNWEDLEVGDVLRFNKQFIKYIKEYEYRWWIGWKFIDLTVKSINNNGNIVITFKHNRNIEITKEGKIWHKRWPHEVFDVKKVLK